jgi:hypothetical protein
MPSARALAGIVDGLGDGLEVFRSDAFRRVAQVVDVQPVGDGAYENFVDVLMRQHSPARVAEGEDPVSVPVLGACPDPAAGLLVDESPHADLCGHWLRPGLRHDRRIT